MLEISGKNFGLSHSDTGPWLQLIVMNVNPRESEYLRVFIDVLWKCRGAF